MLEVKVDSLEGVAPMFTVYIEIKICVAKLITIKMQDRRYLKIATVLIFLHLTKIFIKVRPIT